MMLILTGDNRLKQGVAAEKIRAELRAGARASRARTGSRRASGRWSRSGSPISNGSLENLLHPLRLKPDVVLRRRGAGGLVRGRERGCGLERARELGHVERVDEDAGLGRDELGRAADPRRDDGAAAGHRLEDRLAERLDQRRRADDVGGGEPAGHLVVRDAADDAHAAPPSSARAQRAVADEREGAAAEPRERVGEPHDVLALGQRPDVDERGRLERRAAGATGAEALEVDARVDDLGLAARLRQPSSSSRRR